MVESTKTANYEISLVSGGKVVSFYCALSGMLVCEYKTKETLDSLAVEDAWEKEGKRHFDKCHKCGRWVSSVMYNADVLACVDCAPWQDSPEYCKQCGEKVNKGDVFCSRCGARLLYGGDENG